MTSSSPPSPPPYLVELERRETARRLRTVGVLVAVPLGLIVCALFWWRIRTADPVLNLPAPAVLPRPNAYDVYLQATRQIVREQDIADAVARGAPRPGRRRFSEADKTALVRANARALATARSALVLPYREPTPVPRSIDTPLPHYAKFRNLARLFALDGRLRAARGDTAGAVTSSLHAVRFGQQIPRGAGLIGRLVGIACQDVGRRPVWDALPRLPGSAARAGARRMEGILAQNVGLDETLIEEKYFGQTILRDVFRDPEQFAAIQEPDEQGNKVTGSEVRFVVLYFGKRHIFNNYTQFLDALIAQSRQPWVARPNGPPLPDDPLNQTLLPVIADVRLKYADNETQNALLTTALAARAYQAEHNGTAPPNLAALVPAYLARVPADPFAPQAGAPLRYRRGEGGTPVVYSLGPDASDENGTPIDNFGQPGAKRRYVLKNSLGDAVAGVNVF